MCAPLIQVRLFVNVMSVVGDSSDCRRADDLGRRAALLNETRDALDVVAAAIEHLGELEAVCVAHPVVAGRRNALAVPRRGRLEVVEQVLADDPRVRGLDAVARRTRLVGIVGIAAMNVPRGSIRS